MIRSIAITALPVLFLILLFGGGALFRRRGIDMDGKTPIHRGLYVTSKYLIMVLWAAMALQSWGIGFPVIGVPTTLKWIALCLWTLGFVLLFIGRLGLGESFRIGSAKENTRLTVGGLFSVCRNPMYVGVYSTLLAAMLYTANTVVVLLGVYVIAVHHKIVLAEEKHLGKAFGHEYANYCCRVRRYL